MLIKDNLAYTTRNFYSGACDLIIRSYIFPTLYPPSGYRSVGLKLDFRLASHDTHQSSYLSKIRKAYAD